jgi:competence transcription factor ComK
MTKHLLRTTLFSAITFWVISYVTVMNSLLPTIGAPRHRPVTNIGFPFKYYYQFWTSSSTSPNCGWIKDAFFMDAAITWIAVSIIYFIVKRKSLMLTL